MGDFDASLPLVLLAGAGGAEAARVARGRGLRVVFEAFPDRAYVAGGRLAPRALAGAVLHDPERVAERAVQMAAGSVTTLEGDTVALEAGTLCLHGDHPRAVENARAVRRALAAAGVQVAAF